MPHRFFIYLYNLVLDTLFPWQCLNCKTEVLNDYPLCETCLRKINCNNEFVCPVCLKQIPDLKIKHSYCKKFTFLDALGVVANYHQPILKETIHYFKYKKIKNLEKPLAFLLIEFLKNSLLFNEILKNYKEKILVIPLPLHSKKKEERGFNQSALLALKISQFFNLEYREDILKRTKNTAPQAQIEDKIERMKNVCDAFEVVKNEFLKNKIIILVDDVYTTGATLNEASKVLKQNGAKKVIGVVLAKG